MATLDSALPIDGVGVLRRADHVTERVVDGELVLYDPLRQYVHALNPTAAFVWRACDGYRDGPAIVAELIGLYPESSQTIESDVLEILDLFMAEGLLAE